MRQTERDMGLAEEAGRPSWRPALFEAFEWYPAETSDGSRIAIFFASDRVVLNRLEGEPTGLVDIAVRDFGRVFLRQEAGGYRLTLEHVEPSLSVTLAHTLTFDEASRFRDRLAAHLTRPFLGEIRVTSRIEAGSILDIRRRKLRNAQRPRFLVRRKVGLIRHVTPIQAREIIARG